MPCHSLLSDSSIKAIYTCNSNIQNELIRSECQLEVKCIEVMLRRDSIDLLMIPIARNYYKKKPLFSVAKVGKVAEHKIFILKEEFRRKGIGTCIHQSEYNNYKKNNFDEIHVGGTYDGIIYWKRSGFIFINELEEDKVKQSVIKYLSKIKKMTLVDIEKEIKKKKGKVFNLDYDLLASNESMGILSFSDWLNSIGKLPMYSLYKEIV